MNDGDIDKRAALLRRAFDESFSSAPAERAITEDFLAIRVAGDPFALRMTDVVRLSETPKIVAVPSRRPTVLGVAAIRGTLVSVHSMAMLLGCAAAAGHRWIVIVKGAEAALAFDALEGFLRSARGAVGVLRADDVSRPIIDVVKLTQTIGRSV